MKVRAKIALTIFLTGLFTALGVMVALLSMSSGLEKTLAGTGRDDRVVVTRGGSNGELASFLDRASGTLVKQDPAIARGADGLPLFSITLPLSTALQTVALALVAGLVAAVLPARRAARMDPAQAIRM